MATKMNPQINSVEIGIKHTRTITIFPLSMADQFKMSDIISKAVKEYSENEEETATEVAVFQSIMKLIEENLIVILDLVTEDVEKISLEEITNDQFADLCTIIYDVNFDVALGKLQSLFNRAKSVFQSKRSQLKSSSTPVTDTNISSISPTVEVE
jgi:hypothetical protein